MFQKLQEVEIRFEEIESRLADPDLASRPKEFQELSQEHASLGEIVNEFRNFKSLSEELKSNKELLNEKDSEIISLAKEEIKRLEVEVEQCEKNLKVLLLPKDPNDNKNIILEIRAGAGGEEAALFVASLYRMYQRFAEKNGWQLEPLSFNSTGLGGFKELIVGISGTGVFSRLKWEAGVHRVQRVPETESQGRVHTSTVTVAVLAEAEEVDIEVNPADLRIDVYRASGAGGQHINKTDSAVRITHNPTGIVVACQEERSQHKNKAKALKVLSSRLLQAKQEKEAKEYADSRKSMVGTGDRSERIRTYNFPQGRLTDHRIGLTLYDLTEVMEGKLEHLLDSVQTFFQAEALKNEDLE